MADSRILAGRYSGDATPKAGSKARKPSSTGQSVLVADSHALCRRALGGIIADLAPDHAVAEADCFQCALDRLAEAQFRLVCIDLDMPDFRTDAFETLMEAAGDAPIVLLAGALDRLRMRRYARQKRVAAIIAKSSSLRTMQSVLQIVIEGGRYIPPSIEDTPPGRHGQQVKLTKRQKQVLEGLALGLSTREIAQQLGVSDAMVKAHVKQACAALGARNRVMAVWIAERNGLLGHK